MNNLYAFLLPILTECTSLSLTLCAEAIPKEQLSLFDEYSDVHLIVNGYNQLYAYKIYLDKLFTEFKKQFEEYSREEQYASTYPQEIRSALISIKECEHYFHSSNLFGKFIVQHDMAFLPYAELDERQRRNVSFKLSEFLQAQQKALQVHQIFLKSKLKEYGNIPISTTGISQSPLQWSGTKTEFMELLLSLYHTKKIKGDDLNYRVFQRHCCTFFNIKLDDYSSLETQIYSRKRQSSIFLIRLASDFDTFCDTRYR